MNGHAYYNEVDHYCAQWLRNLIDAGHIAPGDVDERSIEDVTPDDVRGYTQCHFFAGIGVWSYALRLAGWPDDRPVWTGSCPCQGFSAAGKGLGFADERHLWPAWFHLIRERRPPRVFGEQVAAAIRHGWLDLVLADLEGEGYACGHAVFGAHSVGAPHIRQRVLFVADADHERREQHAQLCGQEGGRNAERRAEAARGGEASGLADANSEHGWWNSGAIPSAQSEAQRTMRSCADGPWDGGEARIMGHADDARLEGWELSAERSGERAARQTGLAGFWSDAEWIACRDGKLRPVEPGTFPLVARAAFDVGSGGAFEGKSRAGMLKAYGNAINAQATAAFIRAYSECCVA